MIDCNEINCDYIWSLDQLLLLIPELQKKYGKKAVLVFDAGYNDVVVKVSPTKKVKDETNTSI